MFSRQELWRRQLPSRFHFTFSNQNKSWQSQKALLEILTHNAPHRKYKKTFWRSSDSDTLSQSTFFVWKERSRRNRLSLDVIWRRYTREASSKLRKLVECSEVFDKENGSQNCGKARKVLCAGPRGRRCCSRVDTNQFGEREQKKLALYIERSASQLNI